MCILILYAPTHVHVSCDVGSLLYLFYVTKLLSLFLIFENPISLSIIFLAKKKKKKNQKSKDYTCHK